MTDRLRITIAGAGIGGLAAAAALAARGHAVTVAERAPELGEVGAGIQISPNGMNVIRALGAHEALSQVSIRARAVRLIDGLTGREVLKLDLARHSPDLEWCFVHRARLVEVLADAARRAGAGIRTGRVVDVPPGGAALDDEGLLVGADGLKSVFRAKIDEASRPFFTRQVAWRALVEDSAVPAEVTVWMGPRRHLVSYPVHGGLRNIVAVEERTAWAEEGWSHQDHPANLRAAFAGFAPEPRRWLDKVETVHLWGLFRHRVADRWHSRRQVLLGDAAHPSLPFLAQGANMALEDAWVLADSLERADHVSEALARYEALRKPRVARIVDAASSNARNYHLAFPPLRAAAHAALRLGGWLMPGAALSRFDWLYRHDVTSEDG